MKQNFKLIFSAMHFSLFISHSLIGMQGGRIDGSMSREGMGFHLYHGGYHRTDGGYGYGRAYGGYGRHFGRYSHRGYDRYGSSGYVRQEADPRDNVVARSDAGAERSHISAGSRGISPRNNEARNALAVNDRPRGGQYWGYYSPHYQYGLYPWYYYGDPYFYYQKADYYPWYYGYNPGWLWW